MKNSVTCPNCNAENPFYNSVCSKCKSYLRERVFNLDLWSLISSIIESPTKAFRTIIFSEHKNFIFFILLFLALKYLIIVRFISIITIGDFRSTVGLQISYSIVLGCTIFFFLAFSFLYNLIGRYNNISLRFKDTLSLIIYSQIPLVFGLVILFTLELVIFGDYLFSINPTPFTIKSPLAYLFLILEWGTIIWSIFLLFKAFRAQSQNLFFSLTATIIFFILLSSLLYFYSLFVFTI
jgi:hypothetical protein